MRSIWRTGNSGWRAVWRLEVYDVAPTYGCESYVAATACDTDAASGGRTVRDGTSRRRCMARFTRLPNVRWTRVRCENDGRCGYSVGRTYGRESYVAATVCGPDAISMLVKQQASPSLPRQPVKFGKVVVRSSSEVLNLA